MGIDTSTSKQVMLSEKAYRALAAAKAPGESFSDVVVRTFGAAEARLREFERWAKANLPAPELADSIEEARTEVRWRCLGTRRRR